MSLADEIVLTLGFIGMEKNLMDRCGEPEKNRNVTIKMDQTANENGTGAEYPKTHSLLQFWDSTPQDRI